MPALHESARNHPRTTTAIWFALVTAAVPALILFGILGQKAGTMNPGAFLALLLLPVLLTCITGAVIGSRIVDHDRTETHLQAMRHGMWVILAAYLIQIGSGVIIMTVIPQQGDLVLWPSIVIIGFVAVVLPTMVAGGLAGWILYKLTRTETKEQNPCLPADSDL